MLKIQALLAIKLITYAVMVWSFACQSNEAHSINVSKTTPPSNVELYSYYIPGLVNQDKTGIMIDMLKQIEQSTGITFSLKLLPFKRVQRAFAKKTINAYFPELNEHLPPIKLCKSQPFMQKKIITVVRKDDPLITEIDQLYWKKLGAVTGYSYGNKLTQDPKIKINRVANDDINLKKLLTKRIDVIIGDADSTINSIKANNLADQVKYDLTQPIDLLDVFFVFQNTQEQVAICQKVSNAIEQLRNRGILLDYFNYQ